MPRPEDAELDYLQLAKKAFIDAKILLAIAASLNSGDIGMKVARSAALDEIAIGEFALRLYEATRKAS